jgi:hypothetical protein
LFLLVFVCFCFVFVCFCFCFCLLFIYLVCHSNLYRTLIVFNIALAWRTTILKRTKHLQHYISITWQTFWKGSRIYSITLESRETYCTNNELGAAGNEAS